MHSLYRRIIARFCSLKPQSKKIDQMATKIDTMNETMNKTSPKMFSIFIILSTIPSFYFTYKLITTQYKNPQFGNLATASLAYINIKNILFFSCISVLSKFKFNSPTSKHTVPRLGVFGSVLPPVLCLLALCLPPSENKYIVLPTFIADISTLIVEAQMTNYGILPFWLYSYRHYLRFFDWLIIGVAFFALWNFSKRLKSHPHEFITTKEEEEQTNKDSDNKIDKKS